MVFMDGALARRLERTEGAVGSSFIAPRRRLAPELGATWQDFAGTYAIFDGAESPMTQSFGLGLFAPTTEAALAELEAFFEERGADTQHEVSPLGGVTTSALLAARGYAPVEHSTVLVTSLADATAPASALTVRMIDPADEPTRLVWVATSVAGWTADPAFAPIMQAIADGASHNRSMLHFLVEEAGEPIATASLGLHDGVALLAGASTVERARGRGAQAALLAARFVEARRRGCDLAMMVTEPGSTSQRNSERSGFRVAYSRTKWRRARYDVVRGA